MFALTHTHTKSQKQNSPKETTIGITKSYQIKQNKRMLRSHRTQPLTPLCFPIKPFHRNFPEKNERKKNQGKEKKKFARRGIQHQIPTWKERQRREKGHPSISNQQLPGKTFSTETNESETKKITKINSITEYTSSYDQSITDTQNVPQ